MGRNQGELSRSLASPLLSWFGFASPYGSVWYGSVSPHGLLFILVRNCIRTQFWSASHHPRLHLLQERAIVILKHSCKAWFHNKKSLSNTGRVLENKRCMCPWQEQGNNQRNRVLSLPKIVNCVCRIVGWSNC